MNTPEVKVVTFFKEGMPIVFNGMRITRGAGFAVSVSFLHDGVPMYIMDSVDLEPHGQIEINGLEIHTHTRLDQ